MSAASEAAEYPVTLTKPLGLVFEEVTAGSANGVRVSEVQPGGAASKMGYPWPGDLLLECNGVDLSSADFDSAMEVLINAPERLNLLMAREGKFGCVLFPDGSRAFGPIGEAMEQLQIQVGYQKIPYDCREGTCGVCDMVIRSGDDGKVRPMRMCKARLPKATPDAPEWQLLHLDHPAAKEYADRLRAKAAER